MKLMYLSYFLYIKGKGSKKSKSSKGDDDDKSGKGKVSIRDDISHVYSFPLVNCSKRQCTLLLVLLTGQGIEKV